MAASELSPDSVVVKSGQHEELTPKEYSFLIRTLDNNLIKKDMKQLTFLCADFFDDKKFLAKENVTAHDIFSQMKRNGTISNENLTLLSQLMLLLGKKKLQREVLLPKNIIWEEGMETSLSNFRLMLYKLYQDTQKEDFEKMKQYCSLRLDQDLPRVELERVLNALELFTLLIDYTVISKDDVNYLSDAVKTLGSKRMLKLVTDYKETLPPKAAGQQPEEKNKLSELSPKIVQKPIPSFQGLSSIGGSGPEMQYNRLNSTDTSYMYERASGRLLLRPTDLLKKNDANHSLEKSSLFDAVQPVKPLAIGGKGKPNRTTAKADGDKLSLEKSSLFDAVQPEEPLAIGGKGQPNSTTVKTDEIERKIKAINLSSLDEGHGSSRPNGMLTVTSEPEQNKQSENLDVHSGQHKDMKLPPTEDYERDEDGSIFFPPLSFAKGLPEESADTSANGKGDVSDSDMEGATALPHETHDEPRKPLVSTDDDKSVHAESSFTSRELLETMDPKNVNLTARTEAEETQLNKLKKSGCDNAKSESNSRDSTWNTLPSIHRPPPQKVYKMTKNPRGKCLLLTYQKFDDPMMPERCGNEKDIEALRPLFKEKLFFDVEEHLDLTCKETKRVISKVAREDHSDYDCFVLIICSHGNENALFTKDTEVTVIEDPANPKGTRKKFSGLIDIQENLLTPFKAEKCKSLAGKPKIFFINSCRREDELFQAYVEVDTDGAIAADGPSKGVASNLKLVPNESDFCVVLSTVPGYSSARRREYGTIYVESLVRCLEEDYVKYHLTDILTRVNDDMNESMEELKARKGGKMVCQNSTVINTLGKAVFFGTPKE